MFWNRFKSQPKKPYYNLGPDGYRRIGEERMSAIERTEYHPDGPRYGYATYRHNDSTGGSMKLTVGTSSGVSATINLEREEALSLAEFIKLKFPVAVRVIKQIEN